MNNIKDKLDSFFLLIFKIPKNKNKSHCNSKNIKKWDSLNHVNLILAIESMFKIQMRFDDQTKDVEVKMPYITLIKMTEIVIARISPDELSNEDSIGESVLKEFVSKLFTLNDDLLQETHLQEVQSVLEEAEKIIRESGDDSEL